MIALGVDTGGTYTDAVLVDQATGSVLSTAKSLTTRRKLSIGIRRAVSAAMHKPGKASGRYIPAADIELVTLSTTLATNAIAEGKGVPICLLLIGYDETLIEKYQFQRQLVTEDVVYIPGGHDMNGDEMAALDEKAVRKAILARRDRVEAFAVSGYFGAVNPAHERKVKALVKELSGLPATCGHELTTRLNSVRRATTVALNARLIPLLNDLMTDMRETLDELDITAPLMVVKGDGSLVRARWAGNRPIETILSGPAASAIGAWKLAQKEDVWAVDVGGTTTDIVELRGGIPRINPRGASVDGWQTMVEAVDVHTVGLGGDSHVHYDREGRLCIGPERVVPLCKLAHEYPEVVQELHRQSGLEPFADESAQFLLAWRKPGNHLSDKERSILEHIKQRPRSIAVLAGGISSEDPWAMHRIRHMEEMCLVQRSGFTPTDALHALGIFSRWDAVASGLGAELLARRSGISKAAFCEDVVRTLSEELAVSVVSKVIKDEVGTPRWDREPTASAMLASAMNRSRQRRLSRLDCRLTLHRPLVALGAPVEAYMPAAAEHLNTTLHIPPYAHVANAVGAVSGGVIQRMRITISSPDGGHKFRLHLPEGHKDFANLERTVDYAQETLTPRVAAQARRAGAHQVEIQMERKDNQVALHENLKIYLGTELVFTAFGRPSPASRAAA